MPMCGPLHCLCGYQPCECAKYWRFLIIKPPNPSAHMQGCARAGVRVDTWVESGTEVTPFYDSLIGKLMVHGSSREDAIKRMVAALAGTVLGGIPSNLEYCGAIVGSPGFREGALWGWFAAMAKVCTRQCMPWLWSCFCCQTPAPAHQVRF